MRKNDAFDAQIVNTRLTKISITIFAPDERLPSSATLQTQVMAIMTLTLILAFANQNTEGIQRLTVMNNIRNCCHASRII